VVVNGQQAAMDPVSRAARFAKNTTQIRYQMADIARPVGGGPSTPQQLNRVGYLAAVHLAIRGAVAGTLTVPNALGMASIVSRIRLTANAGVDIVSLSGAGYHYGVREVIESEYVDPVGQSNARSAVTATTYNLDMVIPIAVNLRDPIGLINLQDTGATITLGVDWLADATVATGATVTGTVTPFLILYTVPPEDMNQPDLSTVHSWIEDSRVIAGAGDFSYDWILGSQYLQILHLAGVGAAGTDNWSKYSLRMQQNQFPLIYNVNGMDIEFRLLRGRARPAGLIAIDRLATSGLGNYGTVRDIFDSSKASDAASIITFAGAGNLITVRRGLQVLGGAAA
jgi:hypothetical protein